MSHTASQSAPAGLEVISSEFGALDKIPVNARTFSFWDQFVLWFGAASLPAAWYYGALLAGWNGLGGALLLIVVVSTLSLIPWAYLGHIAAKTGACSMALVRPAFGLRGSILPSVLYLVFGFGWAAVNVFLGGIALSFVLKQMFGLPAYLEPNFQPTMAASLIVVCLIQGFFAVAGHRWIRWLSWGGTIALIVLGIWQTYLVISQWGFATLFTWQPPSAGLTETFGAPPFSITYTLTFALLLDLLIAYNWTWEFIGDFSRFAKTEKIGTWGPFVGANMAQYWWFTVGAMGVVALAMTTGKYTPVTADPSSTTAQLGFGWVAWLILLLSTVTTNAGNIYASALGLSNMLPKMQIPIRRLLAVCAVVIIPLSLVPLLSPTFVAFYIFWLDFLGAIVIPLWTLTLVDFFIVKRQNYTDDLFRIEGGEYWYAGGWNWPAIGSLVLGNAVYWTVAYAFPQWRQMFSATLPTVLVVIAVYTLWMRRVLQPAKAHTVAAAPSSSAE